MDKESRYELQKIDCNCNDCKFMERDFEKRKSFDHLYEGSQNASHRINYGNCSKFSKPVSFIPNHCQLETQECFVHRKDQRFNIKNMSKFRIIIDAKYAKEIFVTAKNTREARQKAFEKYKERLRPKDVVFETEKEPWQSERK